MTAPTDRPTQSPTSKTIASPGEAVDFGFQKVSPTEKTRRVGEVFKAVAERYDVMNDLMSFGTHRLMKRMTVELSGVRTGDRVLDLAGGTGDLSLLFAPIVGDSGSVVLTDINASMMQVGRDRLIDEGVAGVDFVQASGDALPYPDNSFNCCVIAFGLRNFTDKAKALEDILRVLVPGGVLLVLEFSKAENPVVAGLYSAFQNLWAPAGRAIVGDGEPYKYLVESIAVHPNQEALKLMMSDAGFEQTEFHNLVGGVAAIHRGVAPQ